MPLYLYRNPETGDIIELIQSVNEPHIFIDKNGLKWEREFTVPTASIDTEINPMDPKDFTNKTGRKKDTLGSIWDRSREASEKRKKIMGKDTVKENYWKNWSKERGGRTPPPGSYTE